MHNNKIVILGNTNLQYSWFVLTFKQGLKLNGYDVFEIDYRSTHVNAIRNKLTEIKPLCTFTHLTFHPIKPLDEMLDMFKTLRRKYGIKFVHVLADARHEPRYNGDISSSFDLALVSQLQNLQKFSNYWKIPTYFCPYSSLTYDSMVQPVPELSFDIPVFTGNPNAHADRSKFIKSLQKIMPIKIFITQSKNDLRHKTLELSASARCILGLCTGYDIDGYIDVRPFQFLGTGAFMIIRKFKGMDDIIPDDLYIPFYSYNDPYVVKELFEEWKDKNTIPIRRSAFDFIQRYHSSKVRMENVINTIEGKQDSVKALLGEL